MRTHILALSLPLSLCSLTKQLLSATSRGRCVLLASRPGNKPECCSASIGLPSLPAHVPQEGGTGFLPCSSGNNSHFLARLGESFFQDVNPRAENLSEPQSPLRFTEVGSGFQLFLFFLKKLFSVQSFCNHFSPFYPWSALS